MPQHDFINLKLQGKIFMKLNIIKTIIAITSVSTFAFSADEFNIWDEVRKTGYFETSAEQSDEEFQSISKLFPSPYSILGAALAMTVGTENDFEIMRAQYTQEAFSKLRDISNGDITLETRLEALDIKYHSSATANFLSMFYDAWGNEGKVILHSNISDQRKMEEKNQEQAKLIQITEELNARFGKEATMPFAQEMKQGYPTEYYTQNWM